MMPVARAAALILVAATAGCFPLRPSQGGGQTSFEGPRRLDAGHVAVVAGYSLEAVASGLTFPTGVTFDGAGRPVVVEAGYAYGEVFTTPRLVRVEDDRSLTVLATGANPPWNGVDHHEGAFFVAEGGVLEGGRILRIGEDGSVAVLAEDLPSLGDHHTNGPLVRDGWVYFGQGTATNAGVVGLDSLAFGWLPRHPEFHDVPCADVTLTGESFETSDPRRDGA
jgi:hypothetical protein